MSEPSPQPEPKYGDDQFNVPEKACTQFSHAGGVVSVGGGFVFDVKAPRAFFDVNQDVHVNLLYGYKTNVRPRPEYP
jgi:hypothetical protein